MNTNRIELSLAEHEQVSGRMPEFLESFKDTVVNIAGTVGETIKTCVAAAAKCAAEIVKDPKFPVVPTLIV